MEKVIYFMLKFTLFGLVLGCGLTIFNRNVEAQLEIFEPFSGKSIFNFNRNVEAVQKGEQIEFPIPIRVYYDNGSNCKDAPVVDSSYSSYCTVGYGDSFEVLEIQSEKHILALSYQPGDQNWQGRCESGQILCLNTAKFELLKLFRAYSLLTPEVTTVKEHEELPEELIKDNSGFTAILEGQVFPIHQAGVHLQVSGDLKNIVKDFSLDEISENISIESTWIWLRSLVGKECQIYYGNRVKVVGFSDPYTAYVRLMEPESEKKINRGRYKNCPNNTLFKIPNKSLIKNAVSYKESLKLREDFIKSFFVSRFHYSYFDFQSRVNNLVVGQEIKFTAQARIYGIQNIDFKALKAFEYSKVGFLSLVLSLKEEEEESMKHNADYLIEQGQSIMERLNTFFITVPMINRWSCQRLLTDRSIVEDWTNEKSVLGTGKIIGFTEIDKSFAHNDGYSDDSAWFAIVENEIINQAVPELLDCKFVLVSTSDLAPLNYSKL